LPAGTVLWELSGRRCLAVPSSIPGAQLVSRSCDGGRRQQFELRQVTGRARTFVMVDGLTGLCVDVSGVAVGDGVPVIQWPCNGQLNQQFALRDIPGLSGYVQLVARHSGKCVDAGRLSTPEGAAMVQWTCQSGPLVSTRGNQRWRPIGRIGR
jgi:hypothetical protein